MSAASSTSSSDITAGRQTTAYARLATFSPGPAVLWSLLLALAFVGAMELRLAARGFRASVLDSPSLWADWRAQANAAGQRSLVLIGASRIQLGLDIQELAQISGLIPAQLAIDASTPLPVLEHLAADPQFTGRVLMDFYPNTLAPQDPNQAARPYLDFFNRRPAAHWLPHFSDIEPRLRDALRGSLASYSDGASPLQSLQLRIMSADATPAYLTMSPDRSRSADYRRVPMPGFALARAKRHLEAGSWDYPGPHEVQTVAALEAAIAGIVPPEATPDEFKAGVERLLAAAQKLRARGGALYVIEMPTSGYVREIDQRRYPKALFWDVLAQRFPEAGIIGVRASDVPELSHFQCPDGSHLDQRDKVAFTRALLHVLGLESPAL